MKIARDPRLTNPAHAQLLPPCWYTIYELTKLSDSEFQEAIADGTISPEMTRDDIPESVNVTASKNVTFHERTLHAPYHDVSDVTNEVVPARTGPTQVETIETGASYFSDPTTFHAGDRGERVIVTLEMLAGNPAIADNQVAEATLHLKGVTLRARDASPDIRTSVNLCADELHVQVKRHRDKRRRRREARAAAAQTADAGATPSEDE